jgi:hypothetical protein
VRGTITGLRNWWRSRRAAARGMDVFRAVDGEVRWARDVPKGQTISIEVQDFLRVQREQNPMLS